MGTTVASSHPLTTTHFHRPSFPQTGLPHHRICTTNPPLSAIQTPCAQPSSSCPEHVSICPSKGSHLLPPHHLSYNNKAISTSTDTSALYVSHTPRQRPQTPAASRAATISHTAETL